MARIAFEWDAADDVAGNVAHIARHNVTTPEAEHVVRSPFSTQDWSASTGYPITFGSTKAGRYIAVVWSAVGDDPRVVRVITAYEVRRPRR